MSTIDRAGTKQRLANYRKSLLASLDDEHLKKFDDWVKLTTTIVKFGLALLIFPFPILIEQLILSNLEKWGYSDINTFCKSIILEKFHSLISSST